MTARIRGFLPVLAVILSVSSTGCIPGPRTVSPAVKGSVIDRMTKSPIEGARVFLQQIPDSLTVTDSDGRFVVKRLTHFGIIPLIGDYPPMCKTLVIEREGYDSREMKVLAYDREVVEVAVELTAHSKLSP